MHLHRWNCWEIGNNSQRESIFADFFEITSHQGKESVSIYDNYCSLQNKQFQLWD